MPQPRALKVNLIARDNGLGLSRDIALLREALRALGCEVALTALDESDERQRWRLARGWRHRWVGQRHRLLRRWRRPAFDLNIMFEHIWPWQLPLARHNIALPNPEWFDDKDRRQLGRIDQVWAKSRQAAQLFEALGSSTRWIGFDSQPAAPLHDQAEPGFFHLAGGSVTKGTERLLALWLRHPEWPTLTVVRQKPAPAQLAEAANIRYHDGYLDAAELELLRRRHRFHLCPSEAEGYGHYLAEAMSAGAVVITVDAAPMNELVGADRGLLVRAQAGAAMGLLHRQLFDEAAMEQVIEQARRLSPAQCQALGQQAQHWILDNRQRFHQALAQALAIYRDADDPIKPTRPATTATR